METGEIDSVPAPAGTSTSGTLRMYDVRVSVCIEPRFGVFSSSKFNDEVMHLIEVEMRNVLTANGLRNLTGCLTIAKETAPCDAVLLHEEVTVSAMVWGTREQWGRAEKVLRSIPQVLQHRYKRVHVLHETAN